MRFHSGVHSTLFVVAVTGFCALASAQTDSPTYREAEAHWLAHIPPGWRRIPADSMLSANRFLAEKSDKPLTWTYTGGLTKSKNKDNDFEYPYILFQWSPGQLSGNTYEQIESAFGATSMQSIGTDVDKLTDGLITNNQIDTPRLDRSRGRVYIVTRSDVAGIGKLKGLSVGFLGNEGMLSFCYYAPEPAYTENLPQFEALVDSFRYDSGYSFMPAAKRGSFSSPASTSSTFLTKVLGAGLSGAIIGGIWGLIRYFLRPNREAQETTEARWWAIHDELEDLGQGSAFDGEKEKALWAERLRVESAIGEKRCVELERERIARDTVLKKAGGA